MTDWIQLGRARGTPPEDLLRVAAILKDLETAFRPLVSKLPAATGPAVILSDPSLGE